MGAPGGVPEGMTAGHEEGAQVAVDGEQLCLLSLTLAGTAAGFESKPSREFVVLLRPRYKAVFSQFSLSSTIRGPAASLAEAGPLQAAATAGGVAAYTISSCMTQSLCIGSPSPVFTIGPGRRPNSFGFRTSSWSQVESQARPAFCSCLLPPPSRQSVALTFLESMQGKSAAAAACQPNFRAAFKGAVC